MNQIRGFSFEFAISFFAVTSICLGIIFFSPKILTYDEPIFVENVKLLHQLGLGNNFLNSLKGQSPGPLYQIIHSLFEPITKLSPVAIRLLNFLFFLVVVYLTAYYFKIAGVSGYLNKALLYICIPMSWVIVGLALTEMPAMLFLIFSLLLIYYSIFKTEMVLQGYLISLLSGLMLGLAILGRTQFLAVLLASPILFTQKNKRFCVLLFIFSASLMPVYVFYVWRGLVPPDVQKIQSGINLLYGLLAIGYLALMTVFICYKWFCLPRIYFVLAGLFAFVFLLVNLNFKFVAFEPMTSIVQRIHVRFIVENFQYFVPSLLFGIAVLYLSGCYRQLVNNRKDTWFVFLLLAGLLVVLTTVKSSAQFSSRYVVQASPLFVLLYGRFVVTNKVSMVLKVAGIAIGFLSLYSYYRLS